MRRRAVSATASKKVKRFCSCRPTGSDADAVCDADKGFQLLACEHAEHIFGNIVLDYGLRLAERVLDDEHEDGIADRPKRSSFHMRLASLACASAVSSCALHQAMKFRVHACGRRPGPPARLMRGSPLVNWLFFR
jgi:hypothetical protein